MMADPRRRQPLHCPHEDLGGLRPPRPRQVSASAVVVSGAAVPVEPAEEPPTPVLDLDTWNGADKMSS